MHRSMHAVFENPISLNDEVFALENNKKSRKISRFRSRFLYFVARDSRFDKWTNVAIEGIAQNRTYKLYRQNVIRIIAFGTTKKAQENILKSRFNYICISDWAFASGLTKIQWAPCAWNRNTHDCVSRWKSFVWGGCTCFRLVFSIFATAFMCMGDRIVGWHRWFWISLNSQFLLAACLNCNQNHCAACSILMPSIVMPSIVIPSIVILSIVMPSIYALLSRFPCIHLIEYLILAKIHCGKYSLNEFDSCTSSFVSFSIILMHHCDAQRHFVCIAAVGLPLVIISLRWLYFNSNFVFRSFPKFEQLFSVNIVQRQWHQQQHHLNAYKLHWKLSLTFQYTFLIRNDWKFSILNWLDTINYIIFHDEYFIVSIVKGMLIAFSSMKFLVKWIFSHRIWLVTNYKPSSFLVIFWLHC